MKKTNFALMAALYDTKGAGLYQDIYIPIMEYSLALMHSDQENEENYYSVGDLQLIILTNFGVSIPLTVLKQCVKMIVNKNSLKINIVQYENGANFLIRKNWDIKTDESVEEKLNLIEHNFNIIENGFSQYMESQGITTNMLFVDFVKNNSVDIFQYVENRDAKTIINEEYIHVVNYLDGLKRNNYSLFSIANNIFWGSIVAGFLQRDTDTNTKPTNSVEYYLDTSLVLAILDLAPVENVEYSREMLSIITSAGSVAKVNPLTVREIESILYSVERDKGPYPNSSIESAYNRKGLTPTKIMQIRTNLQTLIRDCGVVLDTIMSDKEFGEVVNKYKGNLKVKALKQFYKGDSCDNAFYTSYAEIHDIFILDYIQKKNGSVNSIEKSKCLFITLNADLLTFTRDNYHSQIHITLHPSKLISDLWMHNSKCVDIQSVALTETMSRCVTLNNANVRRKLRIVTKYRNQYHYTDEEYAQIELALINRSVDVMAEIDKLNDIVMRMTPLIN